MAKETYSLPVLPAAKYEFQRNAIELCTTNAVAWGIDQPRLTRIAPLRIDYEAKNAVTNNRSTQSPAATAARDAAWDALLPELVDLYNKDILNNDAIPAESKEALHVHYIGGGGSRTSSAPTTTPIVNLSAEEISVLHVNYADSATPSSHSKPDGVAFCEIWYKLDSPAPVTPDDCDKYCNISRSHDKIVFTPDQRGKVISGFARWVSKTGKTGPWGGIFTAFIP
ncbi:MAG: hypothetical protein Q8909_09615 [Bacteroidota bacterium]|nr:hypothetical protein [Bacteroidota bacterium]